MIKFRNIFLSATTVLFLSACIIYSDAVSDAVALSADSCLKIIIPSMYGFMIVSDFIAKSGIHKILSRPFRIISEYVFRLPYEMFPVFLISCFAGYPAGIKMIYSLLENGKTDRQTAEYMSCFCFSSGPAFIMGTVCRRLYNDTRTGIVLFLSITTANIITALIMRTGKKIPHSLSDNTYKISFSADTLVSAVESSARSMLSICCMIMGFSVFSAVLGKSGILKYISTMICSIFSMDYQTVYSSVQTFLEISMVSSFPPDNYADIPLIASLLSFGGVCVLVQLISMSGGKLNIGKFLFSRLLSSVISWVLCKSAIENLNICVSVSAEYTSRIHSCQGSYVPSVLLIIMTVLLIKEINTGKLSSDSHNA